MSEQEQKTNGYMAELEEWVDKEIFYPIGACWLSELHEAGGDTSSEFKERLSEAEDEVLKKLKSKILESYRNGQAAGPKVETKTKAYRPYRRS
jgi:hypothetical protein